MIQIGLKSAFPKIVNVNHIFRKFQDFAHARAVAQTVRLVGQRRKVYALVVIIVF